ncbi:Fn3 domain-containing protein [Albibacterium bauzanense]|uniref:Fn3 domain-containing protein n=2 Tax=Albibacterium bauzanense TaxID=653929 RepID=A0A4R1M1C6_9SPHI|nr:Fn3 domain-containing protein [Albibacterium bauzanense]
MNLIMNQNQTQHITQAILFLSLLLLSISVNAQGISISPTRMFYSGTPGQTLVQNVTVTNGSSKPLTFNTSTKDWYRDETGEKIYVDANTLPKSNSAWISTSEPLFTVETGASRNIPVTLHIPEQASANEVTNSMLFFSQIGQQADNYQGGVGIGIQVLFEFGIQVFNTPPTNTTQDLEFTAVDDLGNVTKNNESYRRIGVKVKNQGNTISDASVEMELTNKNSGQEIKLNPVNISMLPDAEQLIYFDLSPETKGSFSGVSFIKMSGTTDIRVAEKDFEFN